METDPVMKYKIDKGSLPDLKRTGLNTSNKNASQLLYVGSALTNYKQEVVAWPSIPAGKPAPSKDNLHSLNRHVYMMSEKKEKWYKQSSKKKN